MRVCIDTERCARHGQCVIAAPKIFAFGPDGKITWISEPGEALRKDAEAAADACPEQVITIED